MSSQYIIDNPCNIWVQDNERRKQNAHTQNTKQMNNKNHIKKPAVNAVYELN